MRENDVSVYERSPLIHAVAEVDAAAWGHLTSAIQDGQAELHAADLNDAWNVTARFFPRTGRFSASNCDGQPSLSHDSYPSDLILGSQARVILDNVAIGHGDVVVILSMVPYLRAGHAASPEAVARVLLNEAHRLVTLGLWVGEATRKLLKLWEDTTQQRAHQVAAE